MAKKATILLVDDHSVLRSGCKELLIQAGFDVVGEATNGEEARELFPKLSPEIVLIDLTMQGMGGLECIRRISSIDPSAGIIVLTMHDDPSFAARSIKSGAKGYVTKTSSPEILVQAIKKVLKGGAFFSPDIAHKLAVGSPLLHSDPISALSNREFDIFILLVEGYSTTEIAKNLSLTQKTVSNYLLKIKQKLDVSSVAEMVKLAINHGVDKQNIINSSHQSSV